MKLLSFSFLILFSTQYTMAEYEVKEEAQNQRCKNLDITLDRKVDYLKALDAELNRKQSNINKMVRRINNAEDALDYDIERCREYGRGCRSTNRKIDEINDDKRYYRIKARQMESMISEYNEQAQEIRTLRHEYLTRECVVF